MDKRERFEGVPDPRHSYSPLAQWLQTVLSIPIPIPIPSSHVQSNATSLLDGEVEAAGQYHFPFYSQLPDFAMALLNNDDEATVRYAPLLYHLIGCATCHQAYLEIYDALRAALDKDSQPIMPDNERHSLALTPARMLVYLCRLLIKQAEEVLRAGRHDNVDNSAWARTLLQQSLLMSSHIMQSSLRQRALQNLVDVATVATESSEDEQGSAALTYSSLALTGSGTRKGKTRRRAEMLDRPLGEPFIQLQSGTLEGLITQSGDILELHLHNLDESLRGHQIQITVPLGSLIEPVRWLGGNPRAIRSQFPVSDQGELVTPLGKTDLRLTSLEDHNLLEAMFKKLDIRSLDG